MDDRRKHKRTEILLEARLYIRDDIRMIVPCTITDISEGGARVDLRGDLILPPRVFLLKDEDENIYECETMWRNAQAAGLMFVDLCARAKRLELLEEIRAVENADLCLS